jgi:hypothetical protein
MDQAEINVGMIGPSTKADKFQKYIHDIIGGDDPVGWENQMNDEPAADFSFMRRQKIRPAWLKSQKNLDLIAEYGFTAGSLHRHAQAGIMARAGWPLPDDFGPGRLELPEGPADRDDALQKIFYLFLRFSGMAVEHNRFLDGLKEEPLVGEVQAGLVYQINDFEIAYSQRFFTQQFVGQHGRDRIGTLTLNWRF